MRPVQLEKDIYWVGAIDWDLRDFHGYLTQRGSTYNAYLIVDEKITLVDTVKQHLCEEMLERIAQVVDPSRIDYVVSNHVEMDHSGGLPRVMELAPKATVFTSPLGARGLKQHYAVDAWKLQAVKSGDSLDLGQRKLAFVQTQMVHWPDSMVSYLAGEKLLFSNDAFGQHLASSERFDDELPLHVVMEEARKYYANIVMPHGGPVQKALEALGGLEVGMIAPSHGAVWRSHVPEIMKAYQGWAANQTREKALIVFDSMWGSTEKVAYALQRGFENRGVATRMLNLKTNHISDIMTEMIDAKYLCVGSPTLNNTMMPTVAAFLTYLEGLAPKNRTALAFGSFGWGGQSVGLVEAWLQRMGFQILEGAKLQYIPGEKQLAEVTAKLESALAA